MNKPAFWLITLAAAALGQPLIAAGADYDVRQFGAQPDGKTLCTAAIQKAVNQCAAAGGGTVCFPPGRFLSGTIRLASNVSLLLASNATLLGSTNLDDYPQHLSALRSYSDNYVCRSLIVGENLDRVAILGRGTIDGNGSAFRRRDWKTRPFVIRLINCRDVLVEGLPCRDSPMWMQHYLACDRLAVRGIRVWNHATYNDDGIDVDGCHDVIISDCIMDTDDDCLCLKSTLDRACENVAVTNCVLSSHNFAFKTGSESNGGFKNIALSNCTICGPRYSTSSSGWQLAKAGERPSRFDDCGHETSVPGWHRGWAGIALEMFDGGQLDRLAVSNVVMEGVATPIMMRLLNRARPFIAGGPKPGVGSFRNVSISNLVATGASPQNGCSLMGLPGHPLENVCLSNINISDENGAETEVSAAAAKPLRKYPEVKSSSSVPAAGLYLRHVKDIKLVNIRLQDAQADQRPALVADNVEDLAIDGFDAPGFGNGAASVRLKDVRGALLRGCRQRATGDTFLKVEGHAGSRVLLEGADLRTIVP